MNRLGGGEELGLFMFLTIMFILLAGVVLGVRSFFGEGYDFRAAESAQLRDAVISCFNKNSASEFFASEFDIARSCGLNGNVLGDGFHFVKIIDAKDNTRVFEIGVRDYAQQCFFSGSRANKAYPKCVNGTIERDGGTFDYIIGSNQQGRRIAQ